jgi:hypothetical protein
MTTLRRGRPPEDFSELWAKVFEASEAQDAHQLEAREQLARLRELAWGARKRRETVWALQLARDSGLLGPEVAFFFIDSAVESIVMDRFDPIFEERFALDTPQTEEEERRVEQEFGDAWDATYLEVLREFAEGEMAELLEKDPDEYGRRSEAGRSQAAVS